MRAARCFRMQIFIEAEAGTHLVYAMRQTHKHTRQYA
jgi:hypothetical protein